MLISKMGKCGTVRKAGRFLKKNIDEWEKEVDKLIKEQEDNDNE